LFFAEVFGFVSLEAHAEGFGNLLDGVNVVVGKLGVSEVSDSDRVGGVEHGVPSNLHFVQHGGENAVAKA